jgi:outer membrane protein with beta-barrel domain
VLNKARLLVLILVVGLISAMPAWAQGRTPYAGLNAVGGEVGLFVPRQDGMSTGPMLQGLFEHYLSARDSVRIDVGWANPHVSDSSDHSTRTVWIGGDVLHNWEGGAVHPFVGAGLGAYFLQPRVAGANFGDSATKFGGSVLGGLEYFTSRTFSIKGEARYHVITKSGAYDPSGLSLSVGVKSYF